MWEPFTEGARRAVILAQEASEQLNNDYIGWQHLLLGILARDGAAAQSLAPYGVTHSTAVEQYRTMLAESKPKGPREMIFTPRAKRIIEPAFTHARELSHNYVAEEHLLLGVLSEPNAAKDPVIGHVVPHYEELRAAFVAGLPDGPAISQPAFYKIEHVQLAMPAGEEDRARDFYVGVLGMEERAKPPDLAARGGVWFASGMVQLHLGIDPDFRASAKAHVAMRCRNYDNLLTTLSQRGVVVENASPLPGGRARAYVHDPFGNRIELLR